LKLNDIIRHRFEAPKIPQGKTVEKYIYTDFLDSLIKVLEQNTFTKIESDTTHMADGNLIVALCGEMFMIDESLTITRAPSYGISGGSADDTGKAILYHTRRHKDPYKRLTWALETASALNTSVAPPFYFKQV
jgi:hypothetical protein